MLLLLPASMHETSAADPGHKFIAADVTEVTDACSFSPLNLKNTFKNIS